MQITRGLDGIFVTETRLSRVDGEAGELVVCGFPIQELAPRASFEEVLFLLLHDRLPGREELAALRDRLAERRVLPSATRAVLVAAAARGLDTMSALRAAVASLDAADPGLARGALQAEPRAANVERALALVAALPTAAATYYRLCLGRLPLEPASGLDHTANYLYLLTGEPPEPARVRALETYLNTTVDHGMNASTFTARVIASTRSDMVSAVTGAIGALKGPLHGGAPAPALDMVLELRASALRSGRSLADEAEAWVRRSVASGGRIMGFGHRVYRVRDPRADVLGAAVERLFEAGEPDALYDDARLVEATVLRVLGALKPGRRIQTNVEFYTALLLHGLGLPAAVFTPTFAVARVAGWTAHVLEQIEEDHLIRPRVAYTGAAERRFASVEERDPLVAATA